MVIMSCGYLEADLGASWLVVMCFCLGITDPQDVCDLGVHAQPLFYALSRRSSLQVEGPYPALKSHGPCNVAGHCHASEGGGGPGENQGPCGGPGVEVVKGCLFFSRTPPAIFPRQGFQAQDAWSVTSEEQPNLTQGREPCPGAQPLLFEGAEGHEGPGGPHGSVPIMSLCLWQRLPVQPLADGW